jgi:hypothetical protein
VSHRVFVSEYICGGAWPHASLDSSLALEGRAMLTAMIADLMRIPDVQVTTTRDARLPPPAAWNESTNLDVSTISSPRHEADLFRELSLQADSVFVIAPEFEDLLAGRCQVVESLAGPQLRGCSSQAVQLCTDKLTLAEQLNHSGIETIPTTSFDPADQNLRYQFPVVIKPRNGAGSQLTFLVDRQDKLADYVEEITASGQGMEFIQQPFVSGVAASAAAIFVRSGEITDFFPAGQQLLSNDGRFQYLGCDLPGPFSAAKQEQIATLLRRTSEVVPGLNGYVGFDLIVPEKDDQPPVLVEINPRLTTGYLAWRKLTANNLAERILCPSAATREVRWHRRLVRFRLDDLTQ